MKLYIKQKIFSWTDKYTIYNEDQFPVFDVKGEILSRIKRLHVYYSANGQEIGLVRENFHLFRPISFNLYCEDGLVAKVTKRFTINKRYSVKGLNWSIEGDIFAHDYDVYDDNDYLVARISKKYFSIGDSYEIDVEDDIDELLVVLLVLCIDATAEIQSKYDDVYGRSHYSTHRHPHRHTRRRPTPNQKPVRVAAPPREGPYLKNVKNKPLDRRVNKWSPQIVNKNKSQKTTNTTSTTTTTQKPVRRSNNRWFSSSSTVNTTSSTPRRSSSFFSSGSSSRGSSSSRTVSRSTPSKSTSHTSSSRPSFSSRPMSSSRSSSSRVSSRPTSRVSGSSSIGRSSSRSTSFRGKTK